MTAGTDVRTQQSGAFTSAGNLTATATAGQISVLGTNAGNVTLGGITTMTARTALTLDTTAGDIVIAGSTGLRANNGAVSLSSDNGSLDISGTTSVRGTQVMVDLGGEGAASLAGQTTLTATTGDVSIALDDHSLTAKGKTTITAANDVSVDIDGTGNVALSGQTSILATTGSVQMDLASGDVTLKGKTAITAKQDVAISQNTGDFAASGTSTITAGRDVVLEQAGGAISLSGTTSVLAKNDISLTAQGGVAAQGTTDVSASRDVTIAVETGNITTRDTTRILALGGSVDVNVKAGLVDMNDSTTVGAAKDANIVVQNGSVTMQDSNSFIRAQNVLVRVESRLDPNGAATGDIRIDAIRAEKLARIEALDGRILDNTKAENDINIIAGTLDMTAADGVGLTWKDNIAVRADVVSLRNTRSGGINLQNSTGFTVGQKGVFNYAEGSVLLVSRGVINHLEKFSALEPRADMNGKVGGQEGQGVYLVHNASSRNFGLNLGNEDEAYFVQAYFGPSTGQGGTRLADIDANNPANPDLVREGTSLRGITGETVDPNLNVPFKQWLKDLRNEQNTQAGLAILKAIFVANYVNQDPAIQESIDMLGRIEQGLANGFALDGADPLTNDFFNGLTGMDLDIQQLQNDLQFFMQSQSEGEVEAEVSQPVANLAPDVTADRPVVRLAQSLAEDDLDAPVFAANN